MTQETLKEAIKKHLYAKAFLSDPNNTGFVDRFIEHTKAAEWGAEWQRNHVWHKNTEMPSDKVNKDGIGKPCMVQEGSRVFLCHVCCTTIGKYYFADHSRHYHPIENVDCWAYLDDLMPTSFDKILKENKDVLERLKCK